MTRIRRPQLEAHFQPSCCRSLRERSSPWAMHKDRHLRTACAVHGVVFLLGDDVQWQGRQSAVTDMPFPLVRTSPAASTSTSRWRTPRQQKRGAANGSMGEAGSFFIGRTIRATRRTLHQATVYQICCHCTSRLTTGIWKSSSRIRLHYFTFHPLGPASGLPYLIVAFPDASAASSALGGSRYFSALHHVHRVPHQRRGSPRCGSGRL